MGNVERWLMVKADLRAARKEVLARHGLTEDSLKTLEADAMDEVEQGEDSTETAVAYIVERPVFIHKNSQPAGVTKSLHWRMR